TAEAQAGRVMGRVTDGVGNAVPQARVALVAHDSSAPARVRSETTSGETGGFEFAGVAPGSYTVRVERAGFRGHELKLDLRPGGRETVIARLGQPPRRERTPRERTDAPRPR
ncbi:MAG TPA: carboxypeptidase-like regulatory domain-containing protein, partial [Longimicrobium sp.]|nr:carboxypeptidase-like regulatory domain-containing protein [Longimicrobium sp.]